MKYDAMQRMKKIKIWKYGGFDEGEKKRSKQRDKHRS